MAMGNTSLTLFPVRGAYRNCHATSSVFRSKEADSRIMLRSMLPVWELSKAVPVCMLFRTKRRSI